MRQHGPGAVDPSEMGAAQLVMALAGRLRQSRLTALEPFGLAPHQARAFLIIGRHSRHGDLRPSDLARRLDIAPRSATEVVDALQDKGLVERRPNQTDRRARVLCLTGKGEELFGRLRQHLLGPDEDAQSGGLFAGLTADQLAQLTVLLRKALVAPDAAGNAVGAPAQAGEATDASCSSDGPSGAGRAC